MAIIYNALKVWEAFVVPDDIEIPEFKSTSDVWDFIIGNNLQSDLRQDLIEDTNECIEIYNDKNELMQELFYDN